MSSSDINPEIPVAAELVIPVSDENIVADVVEAEVSEVIEAELSESSSTRSWVFRIWDVLVLCVDRAFGFVSLVLILAALANVPILQFVVFGYLLVVGGQIASTGKFREGFFQIDKISKIGSIIVGTFLVLLPARIASWQYHEAYLIDADSTQTRFLGGLVIALIIMIVPHIMAAWFCGGKLRYFFWPIVAPFSFGLWIAQQIAGSKLFRPAIEATTNWFAPNFVDDLVTAKPVNDWFLPAILWKNFWEGTLVTRARDHLWDFVTSLELGRLFKLGFFGMLGSLMWLLIPTVLLYRAIGHQDPAAIVSALIGFPIATFVFAFLPFLQTRFAETGKFTSFFEIGTVWRRYKRAPLLHFLSLLVLLILAIPPFLFKIEKIPPELLWTLSLVFVSLALPGRYLTGWAVSLGKKAEKKRTRWLRWPVTLLMPVVSFLFVFIFFFSPFVSWNGAYSLFENHAFLLPAPFWLSYFV